MVDTVFLGAVSLSGNLASWRVVLVFCSSQVSLAQERLCVEVMSYSIWNLGPLAKGA